jgi:8-oxo-dGTP pyrophosphatase MutT (NUDIX family)
MAERSREAIAAAIASFERIPVRAAGRRSAAVAVAVVDDAAGCGVLLTRRAADMRAHPGQWALPGGRIDPGESALDAALRELDEELGLAVDETTYLGTLDDYPTRSGYVVTPVVLWCGAIGALRPNPAEVASVHVATLDALDIEPRFVSIPESDAPVIQLPLLGTRIHAPTAAILYQFREVSLHERSTRVAHLEQPVFAWR